MAGIVEELGPGVLAFKPGDAVYGMVETSSRPFSADRFAILSLSRAIAMPRSARAPRRASPPASVVPPGGPVASAHAAAAVITRVDLNPRRFHSRCIELEIKSIESKRSRIQRVSTSNSAANFTSNSVGHKIAKDEQGLASSNYYPT
jgi:hypothetical protein